MDQQHQPYRYKPRDERWHQTWLISVLVAVLVELALLPAQAYADTSVVASVLPGSRSVAVNTPATLFATIVNAGAEDGQNCQIALNSPIAGSFSYQTTDPATNAPSGTPNLPVDIPVGGLQTFVLTLTPNVEQTPVDVILDFFCDNTDNALSISGVNTFTFSASTTPTPDVIALAATVTNNGVIELPGIAGASVFSVASVNVGSAGELSVSADTAGEVLPVNIALCETDPVSSVCINPTLPGSAPVIASIASSATPTFGVFVTAVGEVPFSPAINRIALRFADTNGATRGTTSVAVRTLSSPQAPQVSLVASTKKLEFGWNPVASATFYRLLYKADDSDQFVLVGTDNPGTSQAFALAAHQVNFEQALFRVEACNSQGCAPSSDLSIAGLAADVIGFLKASNAEASDGFGEPAVSNDGGTFAVAAQGEDSSASGVNGDQDDNSASFSGAVYVFRQTDGVISQEAYIKPADPAGADFLLTVVETVAVPIALSGDGNTLAFGYPTEDSGSEGIGGDPMDNSLSNSGAVFVYSRVGNSWTQQAFLKASNPGEEDRFGSAVSLSDDGSRLVVGALRERSDSRGVNPDELNDNANGAGAAYLFNRNGSTWTQDALIKASNAEAGDQFGSRVSISGDGQTLAIAAHLEASAATGVNQDETDNSAPLSGAIYIFSLGAQGWLQEAYVKASNNTERVPLSFEGALDLSQDGNTLAVGSPVERGGSTGINNQDPGLPALTESGAVYVFSRLAGTWSETAYIKSSHPDSVDQFGTRIALAKNGTVLAVNAPREDAAGSGFASDPADNSVDDAGAAYLFELTDNNWQQTRYIKPPLSLDEGDLFGAGIALSEDGNVLLIGTLEGSGSQGVGGDQTDNSAPKAGAVFVY